ncbi:MAG: ABC transporter ATP-binding protein [Acidimicrobiia bacterium]|nr:ABC transporter ATP-binding protein [Acidimicrobiia bacterium]
MLVFEDLRRTYGETVALADLGGSVADGEIVAILGPSGCGKTTLLRILAGLEEPDAGRVLSDGVDLAGVPPDRRGFGLMFQDHLLFPHRTVGENVAFGLRMAGMPIDERRSRVADVMDVVGLAGMDDRSIATLSGGEQQRVALARALAPRPRLLMLDEPLGSLDRSLRERLVTELREILKELGIAAIYVTHDQDEACTIADSVVVMRAGRVEQQGTPPSVWHRPANAFVARFLGWADVADGIGIRPGGVRLDPDGDVHGIVHRIGFRGDHFVVGVTTVDGRALTTSVADTPPESGERVRLTVDADAVVQLSESEEF